MAERQTPGHELMGRGGSEEKIMEDIVLDICSDYLTSAKLLHHLISRSDLKKSIAPVSYATSTPCLFDVVEPRDRIYRLVHQIVNRALCFRFALTFRYRTFRLHAGQNSILWIFCAGRDYCCSFLF